MSKLEEIKRHLHTIESMCKHNMTWEYHETVSDFELINRQVAQIKNRIAEIEKDHVKEGKDYMRRGIVGGFLIDKLDD